MSVPILSRADAALGDAIEAAVRAKHRRRLRRLGWERALDPPDDGPWAAGDPPPRPGCSLEVLVDGAKALPAIAEALQGARRFVHLTGWHVAPHFELVRCEPPVVLGALLAELAERIDVRVLVWAGAPVPAFHPTRAEMRETVRTLTRATRIQCEPDPREHPFHCHHEKTICIDGELAFAGGIDLTDDAGDRFDASDHAARRRLGWHDVGARLRGPAVADVHDDTRGQLGVLVEADDGDKRFLAATIRARSGGRDDPLYVHAKVGIFDDRWLTVGSANLNAHSLLNDTEMNVVTDDPDLARGTRVRLWAEHLELDPPAVAAADPVALVDEHWRPIAAEQLERREAGLPPSHRLVALPGVSKRARRLLGPLEGLTDDG